MTDAEGKALLITGAVGPEDLFDGESPKDPLLVRYTVTEETRRVLESLELWVGPSRREWDGIALGRNLFSVSLVSSLGAMFLAASGIAVQRGRLRKQNSGPPSPPEHRGHEIAC